TAEQPYGLLDRELIGELRILQLNPQALAQGAGARTPRPAHSEDLHLAPVGCCESLEDLDGGRLARPVGPQQPEALACVDGEIEPRDRHDVRVSLHEPGTTDGRSGGGQGRRHGQAGFFGSGGAVACFMAASSRMWRLYTAPATARILMWTTPPRAATPPLAPA